MRLVNSKTISLGSILNMLLWLFPLFRFKKFLQTLKSCCACGRTFSRRLINPFNILSYESCIPAGKFNSFWNILVRFRVSGFLPLKIMDT